MLRRDIIEELGGFNPLFGQGDFEDLEYSVRLKKAGYKLAIRSDICFTHLERQSYVQQVNPETQWQTWINSWLAEVLQ
jgi:GT2 family glycosyltransferase